MGRKPVADKDRKIPMSVSLTRDQIKHVEQRADADSVSVSEYVRTLVDGDMLFANHYKRMQRRK